MMRMQVWISDELGAVLSELAWKEKRWPKQQAEWLLQKALEQVAQDARPQAETAVCRNAEAART